MEDAGIEVLDETRVRTQLAGEVGDGIGRCFLVLAGVVRGAGERVVLPVVVALWVKESEWRDPDVHGMVGWDVARTRYRG